MSVKPYTVLMSGYQKTIAVILLLMAATVGFSIYGVTKLQAHFENDSLEMNTASAPGKGPDQSKYGEGPTPPVLIPADLDVLPSIEEEIGKNGGVGPEVVTSVPGMVDQDLPGSMNTVPSVPAPIGPGHLHHPTAQQVGDALKVLPSLRGDLYELAPGECQVIRETYFKHWIDTDLGNGVVFDVRSYVIGRDSTESTVTPTNKIASATFADPYDLTTRTYATPQSVSRNVNVDHFVPICYAIRAGAFDWIDLTDASSSLTFDDCKMQTSNEGFDDCLDQVYPQTKCQDCIDFANDYASSMDDYGVQLLVTDHSTNQSKGDSGPSEWMPPAKSEWCAYTYNWVQVSNSWGLAISQPDADFIQSVLEAC